MKSTIKSIAVTAIASLIALSSHASGEKVPYTQAGFTVRQAEQQAPIHWVSIEQIKASLKDTPPMNVSFDIDDTVAATSGCFYYGQQKYSPNDHSYLKNQDFWDEINAGCDKYSIPKLSAKALIEMHQARGDQIFLITGRTAGKDDQVTPILAKALGIKNMQPVNFTGGQKSEYKQGKTAAIIKHKVQLHYGDSDDDILAAKEAGIRGIRVLRAANSTYVPHPQAGGYGEEVLINSSY
ncbi:acid phosphatase AphA [Actinobacillus equuli subsp. equuli]|uniref:Class B acid phosphatase n=1 Tax=Actinobacillus equuli subsp. equuli TaxID=202947 RepID=A0A9X4G470_ACTEU|nr:acid phosphatase AphA [Actinobacillus equuli]MDE8034355.1 acid phosphatase AphA [Actinobacillus equuli subsp. equuli]MDG4949123.1 acid phosphatase AphA [Actinobacillus equuli subsp. haemolyticus]WGE47973.1 acid phosphatase AphA [Actinobacillus equuli subsp. equuli]WGE54359.1 acid phosphatase AphA [Actinobacillus equuli subsp. equuli]